MEFKADKGLSESFTHFVTLTGIDIGFIFLQRYQEKNDPQILISTNQGKETFVENKLIEIGKGWIANLNCNNYNMYSIDCVDIATHNYRLMCSIIEYSKEIKGFFFWAFKKSDNINLNKINDFCIVFGNLMIAYSKSTAHLQISKKAEELNNYIINNSPDQIFIKGKDFRFIFSNRSHFQAQKLEKSEVIGKTNYDLGFSKEQIEGDRSKGISGFLHDDINAIAGIRIHNRFDPVTVSDGSIRVYDTYKIPFYENGKIVGVLGYARDITNWHNDVIERTRALDEKTTALKVFFEQREEKESEIEKNIFTNFEKIIIPYLDKLKTGNLTDQQKTLIEIVETNLHNILRPFGRKLSSTYYKLSPSELQIANMIKEGKTTQEIANTLCLALGTIITHRANIRKKLGLRNSKTNLRTYLDNV